MMPDQDPELDALFTNPQDRQVVEALRAARPATPPIDQHFRSYLRSKLMAEARRTLPSPERRPWFRWSPLPVMAAVAAGFVLVLGIEVYLHGQQAPVVTAIRVSSPQLNQSNVDTAEPIRLTFSGPVDRNAVEESIVIQPATQYTTRWEGQTLVVIPLHQLAASTTYTVALNPVKPTPALAPSASVTPQVVATPAPTPVIVHFVTAPSPPPPVTQPLFTSENLTVLPDTRILEPGSFSSVGWTADGQILVTRPAASERAAASASPSAVPSASPTTSPSPCAKTADLWLMSTQGTFIRQVACNVLDPTIAPTDGRVAFWRASGDHYDLMETTASATADEAIRLASVSSKPSAEPVWIGGSRLAYLDDGSFRVVDLQGNAVALASPITAAGAFAGSLDGHLVAVQLADAGAAVYDLTSQHTVALPTGVLAFKWSSHGDLAVVVSQASGSELWVLNAGAPQATKLPISGVGEAWSNLNWSPDARSLLYTSRSSGPDGITTTHAFALDADGTNKRQVGSDQYETLAWSPDGSAVLFTRLDETRQPALWIASVKAGTLSATDQAQRDALTTVKTFMDARLTGDEATATAQLSAAALSVYQTGGPALLNPTKTRYVRWYPVTVQLANPDSFLVGVRIVEAKAYFEERFTVTRQDQRFLIQAVEPSPIVSLAQGGPSVVSVVVRKDPPGYDILIHFDSDLALSTANGSSILIRRDGESVAVESVTYNQDTHLATVKVKLHKGSYTLVVTTALTDINGRSLTQEYSSPLVVGD